MTTSNNGRIALYRSNAIHGAEVLAAYGSRERWHVFYERFAVCVCRTASSDWRYRGHTYSMQDGTVALMQPAEVHRNTAVRRPSDFKVLIIDDETVRSALQEMGHCGQATFRMAQCDDPELARFVHAAAYAIESRAPMLEQQARFVECMCALAAQMEKTSLPSEQVGARVLRRAREYIIDRYADAISLDELSSFCGLSRFHLVRAFHRQYGLSPHAFQVAVRIERARALLRSGSSILDAAMASGFADQSHFTRQFKSAYCMTPGQYARD